MTAPLPFFFAWVNETDNVFGPAFERVDEDIFALEIKQEEGQVATLDITVRNPRVGLLSPGRKVWAWLARQPVDGGAVVPLFFGVLVGVPTDLFKELITLQFIARPPDYIARKQAAAVALKIRPYWDPVFLEEKRRDDPDTILEGWSALYHVDRATHAVTASDILVGEDGTVTFAAEDAFYDSVSLTLGQPPLADVQVQATVNWTQRTFGTVPGPNVNIQSYTGESFLNGWPKPGQELGAGWRVETSFVHDVYKVALTPMASFSSSWTNNSPEAADGDTAEMSSSSSFPALLSPEPLSYITTQHTQSGLVDPDAEPPINRPAKVEITGTIVPLWVLNCTWTLRYEARREFSELLVFNLTANTQAVITSPTVEQDTELLTVSGANVGEPLVVFDAWSDFAGLAVGLGQIIFPNNPTRPGGLSYQVCVQDGTAGTHEPVFSDVVGEVTLDGTVEWASMGPNPLTTQPNWPQAAHVPLGEIICYEPVVFNPAFGDLVSTRQSTYYLCTRAGETNRAISEIEYVPPATNDDEAIPAPQHFFYIQGPFFTTQAGVIVNENGNGTVQWTCLGQAPALLEIPIGGTPEHVTGRCYFPTDRGCWSIEYLICRARARLRLRSRAVKVAWDCPFDLATGLSCRKNATLYDPRLPGGAATGKVIAYSLKAGGDGHEIGHVEIGCAVGFGNSVPQITGTPEYTPSNGYMLPGYQRYDGAQATPTGGDVGYTSPAFVPFDDGLSFPLRELPARGTVSGSKEAQKAAIEAAIPTTVYLNNLGTPLLSGSTQSSTGAGGTVTAITPSDAWWIEELQRTNYPATAPYVMEANPVSYELLIDPVVNGPFNAAYAIEVTALEVPEGINLAAASQP
jgi:hypothetical protein